MAATWSTHTTAMKPSDITRTVIGANSYREMLSAATGAGFVGIMPGAGRIR